ncbi:probable anion transporter 5 [Trichogramma pretiosum]|uniref:probable anion transporter 5 n=1 Tax=Trichogramma pretiosum TaxID=7493 RepID=UPI0006C95915|nr:probable anion transporter 5 [Trichogramma pretiosum]
MSNCSEHTDYYVDRDRILPENYGKSGEPPIYHDIIAESKHKYKLQVLQVCIGLLIFYQSYYMHYGSLNLYNLSVTTPWEVFWPLVLYSVGYVGSILLAGRWASHHSPQRLLSHGLILNGVLHCVYAIMIHLWPYHPYNYPAVTYLLYKPWHVLHGVVNSFFLPSAYTILARNVPARYRATVGSLVLSMKWFILPFSWLISCVLYNTAFMVFAFITVTLGSIYIWITRNKNDSYEFVDQKSPNYRPLVPWSEMFRSLPVWTLIVTHAVYFATQFYSPLGQTMTVNFYHLTTYEELRLLQFERIVSELPRFFVGIACTMLSGCLSDWLVAKGRLTRDRSRKVFQFLGGAVPMGGLILLRVLYVSSFHTYYQQDVFNVVKLGVLVFGGLACVQSSGFLINHMDLSPYYAGLLVAISEVANQVVMCLLIWIFGFYSSDALTIIQMIAVPIFCIFASFFFLICARTDIQNWSPIPLSLFQSRQPTYVGPLQNPFHPSDL